MGAVRGRRPAEPRPCCSHGPAPIEPRCKKSYTQRCALHAKGIVPQPLHTPSSAPTHGAWAYQPLFARPRLLCMHACMQGSSSFVRRIIRSGWGENTVRTAWSEPPSACCWYVPRSARTQRRIEVHRLYRQAGHGRRGNLVVKTCCNWYTVMGLGGFMSTSQGDTAKISARVGHRRLAALWLIRRQPATSLPLACHRYVPSPSSPQPHAQPP